MRIPSPEIPLDFTEEEIQRVKDYAHTRIKRLNPPLRIKKFREEMPTLLKLEVLRALSTLFEEEVERIKIEKNER